eukprot:ANDGO_06127.mRNA.1 putative Golgi SNAP receptor complex member 2
MVHEKQKADRDALFHRRATASGSAANGRSAHFAAMESLDREKGSLMSASSVMDSMLAAGSSVLTGLTSQKEMLMGASRKAQSVAISLGLGNQVMKMIYKRQLGDRMLVYGGMIAISILLLLIYIYVL